jgi:hypothetical protein
MLCRCFGRREARKKTSLVVAGGSGVAAGRVRAPPRPDACCCGTRRAALAWLSGGQFVPPPRAPRPKRLRRDGGRRVKKVGACAAGGHASHDGQLGGCRNESMCGAVHCHVQKGGGVRRAAHDDSAGGAGLLHEDRRVLGHRAAVSAPRCGTGRSTQHARRCVCADTKTHTLQAKRRHRRRTRCRRCRTRWTHRQQQHLCRWRQMWKPRARRREVWRALPVCVCAFVCF